MPKAKPFTVTVLFTHTMHRRGSPYWWRDSRYSSSLTKDLDTKAASNELEKIGRGRSREVTHILKL